LKTKKKRKIIPTVNERHYIFGLNSIYSTESMTFDKITDRFYYFQLYIYTLILSEK